MVEESVSYFNDHSYELAQDKHFVGKRNLQMLGGLMKSWQEGVIKELRMRRVENKVSENIHEGIYYEARQSEHEVGYDCSPKSNEKVKFNIQICKVIAPLIKWLIGHPVCKLLGDLNPCFLARERTNITDLCIKYLSIVNDRRNHSLVADIGNKRNHIVVELVA